MRPIDGSALNNLFVKELLVGGDGISEDYKHGYQAAMKYAVIHVTMAHTLTADEIAAAEKRETPRPRYEDLPKEYIVGETPSGDFDDTMPF